MSMADDNTLRAYRTNDPYRRDPSQPAAADSVPDTDPLSELARLIGQTDPFADPAPRGQQHPQAAPPPPPPNYAEMRAAAMRGEPVAHAQDSDADQPPYDSYQMAPPAEHPANGHGGYDQYQHDLHDRSEPQFAASDDYPPEQPAFHAAPSFSRGDRDAYQPQAAGRYGEDDYDDPPPRRRKSGLVTALTLVACAMLGTVGAYAYRTMYAEPGTSRAPVIVADRTPAKVVPNADAPQSDKVQERAGDPINERLVSREEQPMALKPPAGTGAPRVVFPSPVQPNAGGAAPQSAAPPSGANEPKRVRTVTIRPDGTALDEQPAGNPAPAARTAATEPRASANARAAQPATTTPAPRAAQPTRQASRNEPLSLDPTASAPAAEPMRAQPQPPQQPQRPVTAPAPRLAAVPPAGGAASSGAAGGGYVVQLSSQRSEADARASFRAMQTKYPQVLNGRQPIVKRADLGAKGVYYRAMVGPFGSSNDASQFCNSLKAAGGQCIIQRN